MLSDQNRDSVHESGAPEQKCWSHQADRSLPAPWFTTLPLAAPLPPYPYARLAHSGSHPGAFLVFDAILTQMSKTWTFKGSALQSVE